MIWYLGMAIGFAIAIGAVAFGPFDYIDFLGMVATGVVFWTLVEGLFLTALCTTTKTTSTNIDSKVKVVKLQDSNQYTFSAGGKTYNLDSWDDDVTLRYGDNSRVVYERDKTLDIMAPWSLGRGFGTDDYILYLNPDDVKKISLGVG